MGKPFNKELGSISNTLKWAFDAPLHDSLKALISVLNPFPLLVVGSGGSLSSAHFVARLHEQTTGQMAQAITPLELIVSNVEPSRHAILLVTAGGNNKDILKTLDVALNREFGAIGIICARLGSELVKKSREYPHVHAYEFPNPVGKDGFLAVNSLLSTCVLVNRAYNATETPRIHIQHLIDDIPDFQNTEWDNLLNKKTIVALGGGWAWPAIIDLESKFTEAALGNVLITDYRNFGHGRHHWFDKKGNDSALLVLETPPLSKLARKTLALLPSKYPSAILSSFFDGPLASIDLLKKIFYLVKMAGVKAKIDPGKPKVPEFGKKYYHIGLSLAIPEKKIKNKAVWIQRKARVLNLPPSFLEEPLERFLDALRENSFSAIVFDYDGTLCDQSDRFTRPQPKISEGLNSLLSKDIALAIATGRGRSVQKSLREVIEKTYWNKVLIGNYNCSLITPLINDLNIVGTNISETINNAYQLLEKDVMLTRNAKIEIRLGQVSVMPEHLLLREFLLNRIAEILSDFNDIHIVQSDHSIDILDSGVSKTNALVNLRYFLNDEDNILVIGDQGQYGGNDFKILNMPFSLSVDKVSSSLNTCWNLSPIGIRGAKATMSLIDAMKIGYKKLRLDVDALEGGGQI